MTPQDTMRLALEALETHVPHYLKDRGYAPIEALKAALAQQGEQQPVTFLSNGMRFKLSLDDEGKVSCFWNRKELDGRWVALVAAEDNCHLELTAAPAPQAQHGEPETWTDDGGWTFPIERQIIQTR